MHLKPLLRYRTFGRSYRHFAVAAVVEIFPVACGSMAVFVGRASKPRWARAMKLRGLIGFAARSRALCVLLRLLRSVVRSAKLPCYAGYLSHIMDQYQSWIKDSHATESLVKLL